MVSAQNPQAVMVRSGDHESFSRIVLALPRRVGWRFAGSGRVRDLNFDQTGWRFDTSTVFQRMRQDRLESIKGTSDGLRLTLACECVVEGFWHGQSMLVIDIRDPAVPRAASEEQTAGPAERVRTASPPELMLRVQAKRDDAVTHIAGRSASDLVALSLGGHIPSTSHISDQADPRSAPDDPQLADLSVARRQLAKQISRAASMGLLSPETGLPQDEAGQENSEDQASPAEDSPDSSREDSGSADTGETRVQLQAETSVDRDVLAPTESLETTDGGAACLPDRMLDVAGWAEGDDFPAQIGPARARLTGEFDRFSETAVLDLARLYLYFGFGAEAEQVMRAAQAEGREVQILRAMARIVETGSAEGSLFSGQLSCDSTAAVWSALSYPQLPGDASVDLDAILRGIMDLPRPLRDHLVPGLARKFAAADQPAAADEILRLVERGGRSADPVRGLARAEVDLLAGNDQAADDGLGKVVDANAESSAVALVRQIDARLRTGRAIPQDMADLAGAYAYEKRDTEIGHDLLRAYIEASAASGAFEHAFSHRSRFAADIPDGARQHIDETLFTLLTQNADDVTFLRYALSMQAEMADRLQATTENAIARRLIDTGFPDSAKAYLANPAQGQEQRERRILRATAALALSEPRQAQVELLGLAGQDVSRLRADARVMVGQFDAARELYDASGSPDAAQRAAMQAEDWDQVAASGAPGVAALTALSGSVPDTPPDDNLLAHNRALIEASAATRSSVDDLLRGHVVPGNGDD